MPVNIHDSHTVGPVNLPPHPHVAETFLSKMRGSIRMVPVIS
jgi:hypothetical protein